MSEVINRKGITIDIIMIVGKYFCSNKDFINTMKACKKYSDLVLLYHFNPISDTSLFENMETQHLYRKEDSRNIKENMIQYVHWYNIDYKVFKNSHSNEMIKRVQLNDKENVKKQLINHLEPFSYSYIVPEGITSIGNECFYGCTLLTSIQLPSSLKSISEHAFSYSGLKEVIIPDNVTLIGNNCFYRCTSLTSVQLPSSLKSIGERAFAYTNIPTITIPEGTLFIGNLCFSGCTSLTNVKLPSSLLNIDYCALIKTSIQSIAIPEGIKTIGSSCFNDCTALTSVKLPSTLTNIGNCAFVNTSINSIELSQNITKINKYVFFGCSCLEHVKLPSELTYISLGAFSKTNLKEIEIPPTVKHIGSYAFRDTKIKEVKIPMRTHICKKAFPKKCKIIKYRLNKSTISCTFN